MAVSKDYDGSRVQPSFQDGAIRVTSEWLHLNVKDTSAETEQTLQDALLSWSFCPRSYWFNDTPDVRRVLGIEAKSN